MLVNLYLVNNNITDISLSLSSGIDSSTLSINADNNSTISDISMDLPVSGSIPNQLMISLENPLSSTTIETDLLPSEPNTSNSPPPLFIKVCGFEQSIINGTYSYWGLINDYPYWTNPNSYELKFDTIKNGYVLGIVDNLYEYYLYGTNEPTGLIWKNATTNNAVVGASTIIDLEPFSPCS